MFWKWQHLVWIFLPPDRAASYTMRIFGFTIVLGLLVLVTGLLVKRRWLSRTGTGLVVIALLAWGLLILTRPAWLRIAMQPVVPSPTITGFHWETRAPGLETADMDLHVGNEFVDHMALTRLDPHRYHFSVHWAPTGMRTAEMWQHELGATVVVNGSYYNQNLTPFTPLRLTGKPAGPESYESDHGVFVADGEHVEILDLKSRDVFKTIDAYPEAMVSYPMLLDPAGNNRATESKVWLAARNFVAIDKSGRIILGTTQTGFFSLHRLGDFLKSAPLDLHLALNFDGGPLVSQAIRAGGFQRNFHGKAEISDEWDLLRAFWQAHLDGPQKLPIVLVATPVSQ